MLDTISYFNKVKIFSETTNAWVYNKLFFLYLYKFFRAERVNQVFWSKDLFDKKNWF